MLSPLPLKMKLLLVLCALSCAFALNSVSVDDGMFQGLTAQGLAGSGSELRLVSEVTLPNGKVKRKYEQFFNGLRVVDTAVTVTVDNGGVSETTGNIYDVDQQQGLMSLSPITSDEAVEKALQAKGLTREQVENIESELIIDPKQGEVYEVNFFIPAKVPERPYLQINAQSGEVVDEWKGIDTAGYLNAAGPGGNKKTGKYMFGPGTALGPFTVKKVGNKCTMENDEVKAIDLKQTQGSIRTSFVYDCPNADNMQTSRVMNEAFSPINDGYYFGNVLYKMYNDWVQLKPLNFKLTVRVHYGSNYENAFWNGRELTFGDGKNRFFPLVDINVVTHEAAHGFTGQNSGLVYRSESGGMNEAYSDIAGEAAEQYARGNVDWVVGSDIFKQAGAGLRYFIDPTKDRRSIKHMSKYYEGMNVHYSSGLYNRAFYVLANTAGWDIKKCFQIFTFANKLYWTRDSKFNAGVCGVLKAAKDLQLSEQDVKDAFADVGLACSGTLPTKAPVTKAPVTKAPVTQAPKTPAPTLAPLPNPCKDIYSMCSKYKQYCTSSHVGWKNWTRRYCADTCGHCKNTTPAPVCKDNYSRCSSYTKYCNSTNSGWKDWVKRYCAKTCKLC